MIIQFLYQKYASYHNDICEKRKRLLFISILDEASLVLFVRQIDAMKDVTKDPDDKRTNPLL